MPDLLILAAAVAVALAIVGIASFLLLVIRVWYREPKEVLPRLKAYWHQREVIGCDDWRDAVPTRLWERFDRRDRVIPRVAESNRRLSDDPIYMGGAN